LPASGIVLIHLTLAVIALAAAGSARWWVRRGANHDVPAKPSEVVHLNAGARLVVLTGLLALRQHRLVRAHPLGIVAVRGATRPERVSALLAALQRPRSGADLLRDAKVQASADLIATRMVRRGWVLPARLPDRSKPSPVNSRRFR
jgi:uncharacterized protein (TIGR04222 family)